MIETGDQHVYRFRRDRLNDLCDLVRRFDAWRIKTIGTRFRIGDEAVKCDA